jgi:hypothetical protein
MKQFFDFYLQNKPAPTWMIEGLPAMDKGKRYGWILSSKLENLRLLFIK